MNCFSFNTSTTNNAFSIVPDIGTSSMDHPPLEHVWMVDNSPLYGWSEMQHPTGVPSIQVHRWVQHHSSFPMILGSKGSFVSPPWNMLRWLTTFQLRCNIPLMCLQFKDIDGCNVILVFLSFQIQELLLWIIFHWNMLGWLTTLQSVICQKQNKALTNRLNLKSRQVEVWFQNCRRRTQLKHTEVDCELLKHCCETVTEENRRLQREVEEPRAIKLAPPCVIAQDFYMPLPVKQ